MLLIRAKYIRSTAHTISGVVGAMIRLARESPDCYIQCVFQGVELTADSKTLRKDLLAAYEQGKSELKAAQLQRRVLKPQYYDRIRSSPRTPRTVPDEVRKVGFTN